MKRFFGVVLLSCTAGLCAFAQAVSLDAAIQTAAEEMSGRIKTETTIAIVSFGSTSQSLSGYIIEEIGSALVNDGRLTVVERDPEKLDEARNEKYLNDDAEEFDPRYAKQFARLFGATMLISGSISPVGGAYRLTIQALEVETGIVRYKKSFSIQNDKLVKSLMADSSAPFIEDYTTAERAGAAALNLVFGIGSFSQKDKFGGIVTAAIEAVGVVTFIIGLPILSAAQQIRNDAEGRVQEKQEYDYSNWTGGYGNPPKITVKVYLPEYDRKMALATEYENAAKGFMIAGGILYAAGVGFGVYRAFTHHKPGSIAAVKNPLPLNIGLVSDRWGNPGLHIGYTFKY